MIGIPFVHPVCFTQSVTVQSSPPQHWDFCPPLPLPSFVSSQYLYMSFNAVSSDWVFHHPVCGWSFVHPVALNVAMYIWSGSIGKGSDCTEWLIAQNRSDIFGFILLLILIWCKYKYCIILWFFRVGTVFMIGTIYEPSDLHVPSAWHKCSLSQVPCFVPSPAWLLTVHPETKREVIKCQVVMKITINY